MQFRNKANEKGQAVLIVLLSLSIVLIIVLYIMSRSITDISLSSKDENSMRAFSAAEAGIERALVIGSSGAGSFGDANFTADVSDIGSGENQVVYPIGLKSGETAIFWFNRVGDPTNFTGNQVKVCWGAAGTSAAITETPAIEFTVYYKTTLGEYRVARTSLDVNTARALTNNFSAASNASCTIAGETFQFQSSVSFLAAGLNIPNYATPDVLQYATVKILYNTATTHKIGLDVSATASFLPSQGSKIDSQGSFDNANRRIEVYQLNPEVPPIFANVLHSSSDILK